MATAAKMILMPGVTFADVRTDSDRIVPVSEYRALAGWDKLGANDQQTVLTNGRALAQAMLVNGYSRLAIGAYLTEVQAVLEPHSMFGKFLKMFHFTPRTGYRFIAKYKHAQAKLPPAVLKAAMARGIDMAGEDENRPLGKYTDIVKKLPPPKEADPTEANAWLDRVEDVRRTSPAPSPPVHPTVTHTDPETATREVLWFVRSRYKKLAPRSKKPWANNVLGMLMTEFQLTSISPVGIPPELIQAGRGRPRSVVAQA